MQINRPSFFPINIQPSQMISQFIPNSNLKILPIGIQSLPFPIPFHTRNIPFMAMQDPQLTRTARSILPNFNQLIIRTGGQKGLFGIPTDPIYPLHMGLHNHKCLHIPTEHKKSPMIGRKSRFQFRIVPNSKSGIQRAGNNEVFFGMKSSAHNIVAVTSDH